MVDQDVLADVSEERINRIKFNRRRFMGRSEDRKRFAMQEVYDMIPHDYSMIQWKELKKRADDIKMSTATLSAHLKDLKTFEFIERKDDHRKTYYKRLKPVELAIFPSGIEKVHSITDMLEEVPLLIPRTKFQCADLFGAAVDACVSSLALLILTSSYYSHARFQNIPLNGLDPDLAAKNFIKMMEDMYMNSHMLLEKEIDLTIRPVIHELQDLGLQTIFTEIPHMKENVAPLRAVLVSKCEQQLEEALSKINRFEKVLEQYKQKYPPPKKAHE